MASQSRSASREGTAPPDVSPLPSFAHMARIKVIVVPVGNIDRETFLSYYRLIASFHTVPLVDLTLDVPTNAPSLYKNQVVAGDGQLHFHFVNTYAKELVQLEEFQLFRQIVGVIGIVHCPNTANLSDAFARFSAIVQKYPRAQITRCFAFEPDETQADNERNVIMIPNQSRKQLSFYIGTMINDFASQLLQCYGSFVESIEKRSMILSPMQYDTALTSSEDATRVKKRTPGRAHKLVGDVLLQGGCLADAMHRYQQCIEASKLSGDFLWHSGALEGLYCATLLQLMLSGTGQVQLNEWLAQLPVNYREIIGLYERAGVPILAVEACINVARIFETLKQRADAATALGRAWMLADQLAVDDRLYAAVHIALQYRRMQMMRKYAFFTRQSVMMLYRQGNPYLALACAKRILPVYYLDAASGSVLGIKKRMAPCLGWTLLKKVLCKEIMEVAESTKDPAVMTFYTTLYMRQMHQFINVTEQTRLMNSLKKFISLATTLTTTSEQPAENAVVATNSSAAKSVTQNDPLSFTGLPVVRRLSIQRMASSLALIKHVKQGANDNNSNSAANNDPFIYNPFQKKTPDQGPSFLVENEPSTFVVSLDNPMAFPLEVQSICISAEGTAFEATRSTLTLPAYAQDFKFTLQGRPLSSGSLHIRGCIIKVLNYEREHLIDAEWNGLEFSQDQRHRPNTGRVGAMQVTPPSLGVSVEVIEAQPFLKVQSSSLINNAVMLVQGEQSQIALQLENMGYCAIDHVQVHFIPKKLESVLPATTDRLVSFEREYYAMHDQVFSWNSSDFQSQLPLLPSHGPGTHQTGAELVIHAVGRQGSLGGVIKIEYGFMGDRAEYYTRHVEYPVLMTVRPGLECVHWDILPYQPQPEVDDQERWVSRVGASHESALVKIRNVLSSPLQSQEDLTLLPPVQHLAREYCIVALGLRNTWTYPMQITISVSDESLTVMHRVTTTIQPDATKRLLVPMKRIHLSDEHLSQTLPPIAGKQFVVPQGPKLSAAELSTQLCLFWFKKAMLDRLRLTWQTNNHRQGVFDLYHLQLNKTMVSSLRSQDLTMSVTACDSATDTEVLPNVDVHESQIQGKVWQWINVRFVLKNWRSQPIQPTFRVMAVEQVHQEFEPLDTQGKVVFGAPLQMWLDEIAAEGIAIVVIPLLFLACGKYRFLYHCQEGLSQTVYWGAEPLSFVIDEISS